MTKTKNKQYNKKYYSTKMYKQYLYLKTVKLLKK